jgi:hypothetical protein
MHCDFCDRVMGNGKRVKGIGVVYKCAHCKKQWIFDSRQGFLVELSEFYD